MIFPSNTVLQIRSRQLRNADSARGNQIRVKLAYQILRELSISNNTELFRHGHACFLVDNFSFEDNPELVAVGGSGGYNYFPSFKGLHL